MTLQINTLQNSVSNSNSSILQIMATVRNHVDYALDI